MTPDGENEIEVVPPMRLKVRVCAGADVAVGVGGIGEGVGGMGVDVGAGDVGVGGGGDVGFGGGGCVLAGVLVGAAAVGRGVGAAVGGGAWGRCVGVAVGAWLGCADWLGVAVLDGTKAGVAGAGDPGWV